MRKFALLLLFTPALLAAQAVSVAAWPDGSEPLNQGWRTHAGDNLAWAQPGFDDSAWTTVSFGGESDDAGWRWYRRHVHVSAGSPQLALLVTGGDGAYEVYVNGSRMSGPRLKSAVVVTLPREE